MKCVTYQDMLRYVAGTLTAESVRRIDRHVSGCEVCLRLRDELQAMIRRLGPDPGEFDQPAIADEVMTLVRLGRARPGPAGHLRFRLVWWPAVASLAALLALVVVVVATGDRTSPGGMQVRAGADDPSRWVSIKVFRASRGGYEPVPGRIRPDDALAFTYQNRDERYRHLMVLAVDGRERVFWYYPALTGEGHVSRSIPIEGTAGRLPDEIRHDLQAGRLRLFAVFSASALAAGDVEHALARDLASARDLEHLERITLPGTGQHSILLQVQAGE